MFFYEFMRFLPRHFVLQNKVEVGFFSWPVRPFFLQFEKVSQAMKIEKQFDKYNYIYWITNVDSILEENQFFPTDVWI